MERIRMRTRKDGPRNRIRIRMKISSGIRIMIG
jgi:hypothetical protein